MYILASDFDGTLNYGGIHDGKRAAISQWRNAGNRFGLVSGRNLNDLIELVKTEAFECDFLLANNGAVLADAQGNKLSDTRVLGDIVPDLIQRMFDLGCPFARIAADSFYYYQPVDGDTPEYAPITEMPTLPYFTQISSDLRCVRRALEVADSISRAFDDYINVLPNGTWLDIVAKGVDKAYGLRQLLKLYGCDEKSLITVGDAANDAAMLTAFRSYAMAHAEPAIRALADAVTPDVDTLIHRELAAQKEE